MRKVALALSLAATLAVLCAPAWATSTHPRSLNTVYRIDSAAIFRHLPFLRHHRVRHECRWVGRVTAACYVEALDAWLEPKLPLWATWTDHISWRHHRVFVTFEEHVTIWA